LKQFKKISLILLLAISLSACVKTIVGAAVDATIEVVKVPFKVGGAVIDVAKGDPKDSKNTKKDNSDKPESED